MNSGPNPSDVSCQPVVEGQAVSARITPTLSNLVESVFDSLIQSAASAFLIWMMGSIALTIAGGIAGDMLPSKPPGVHWNKAGAPALSAWAAPFRHHPFLVCFALVAVPTTWRNLRMLVRAQGCEVQGVAKRPTRLSKIGQRLAEGWFTLLVVNAFGAMLGAMLIDLIGNLSPVRIALYALFGSVGPQLVSMVTFLFGPDMGATFGAWLSWYGENQLKFTFWLLYLTAACDDLGIPNIKSAARWCWRRMRARGATAP